MTLMALTAKPKRFRLAASNVLCGAVAGAPMGVCTNCATPIGQSLLAGGASARMTVAAMISSPSFNPIVVAMVFVLFPTPLAVLRIGRACVTAGGCCRCWCRRHKRPLKFMAMPELRPNFAERLLAFVRNYGVNLLRLTWMTLPWMLLAAVLGAFAAETIPAYGTHLHASVWGIALVAIFGTLLPVPMALDVALAFVLYKAGAPATLCRGTTLHSWPGERVLIDRR